MDDLARDPEGPSNGVRAGWAVEALETFARKTGQLADVEHDPGTVVGDLLANLHHLTDVMGVDWDTVEAQGREHYLAERLTPPYQALAQLQDHLSGREWGGDTWGRVAEILGDAGFALAEPQ